MSTFAVLDASTVEQWISEKNGIILCHKKLCPHCKVMHTVLEKARNINGDLHVACIDSEEQSGLMEKYHVERVPVLLICKAGDIVQRKNGIMNPNELLTFYDKA